MDKILLSNQWDMRTSNKQKRILVFISDNYKVPFMYYNIYRGQEYLKYSVLCGTIG